MVPSDAVPAHFKCAKCGVDGLQRLSRRSTSGAEHVIYSNPRRSSVVVHSRSGEGE